MLNIFTDIYVVLGCLTGIPSPLKRVPGASITKKTTVDQSRVFMAEPGGNECSYICEDFII